MQQLNYTQYVIQGGDFGGITLRYQAHLYPDNVVSVLANFWPIPISEKDMARFDANKTTPDETAYIERLTTYSKNLSAYNFVQRTRPLQLAYGMTASPIGFTMWIYDLMKEAIDTRIFNFSPEEIITWSMMYIIQGPYGGFRLYKEALNEGAIVGNEFGPFPYVHQPVAISEFPYDVWYPLPLDWAQREGNVKVRNVHYQGGHFAAYEDPEILAGDIWRWFGDAELSGTSVFRKK